MRDPRRSLLAATIFALSAAPAAARAEYYDVTQLQHQNGKRMGAYWRSEIPTSYCNASGTCGAGPFTTYGPFVTNLPPGDNMAITMFGATGSTVAPQRWTTEVYDGVSARSLISKSFTQPYTPGEVGHMSGIVLPFQVSPNHNIQVRTRNYGAGTLDQCGVQIITEASHKIYDISPYRDQSHQGGWKMYLVNDDDVWAINEQQTCGGGGCSGKFMTYGPNWNLNITAWGGYVALFRFAVNDQAGVYGSNPVVTVDVNVWDGSKYRVIASRDVFRSELDTFGKAIPLKFDAGLGLSQYQFRVRYWGRGEVVQMRTKIYDPRSGACIW